ncbi:MAG: fumarylacetoacetate hydrolase family protein [Phycisphaerales bacterium]|nr:fumarylacetoacetate hydrolase family protein [Phycisphaerales bacterium]
MTARPPAVFAIGRNYAEHAAEMGAAPPSGLMVFMKNPACVVPSGTPIIIPPICREHGPQVDFEGELCLEFGSDCTNATAETALSYLRGFRVANDVSARWWQKEGAGGQFCRGKSFDTFCPVSPLVPASQVSNPDSLGIRTWVSGELMQDGNTKQMIWPVAALIVELSRGTTLLAGSLILTGTPAGVGAGRKPPRFLRAGDEVRIEIEGVGEVINRVVDG